MKIKKEQLKQLRNWLTILTEEDIEHDDPSGYLDEEKLEEIPDEVEIEDICLSFPYDQDYANYSIDEFKTYMSEIDTLRKVNDFVVRTDHIIQAVISSSRIGYSGFESELYGYKFKGEDIDVTIENYPFLVGLINTRKEYYDGDLGYGACEPYPAIVIRSKNVIEDSAAIELAERICFYLTDSLGVAVYPWSGPDINEIYDTMDEYYEDDEDEETDDEEERAPIEMNMLPSYSPLLKMYRQAKGVDDQEIQFLQYYKIIEYISPVVARRVAYEQLNKRLDMLPAVKRDYKYLDSIIAVARKYDKDMRDDSLAASVIENCVDVVPLYGMFPDRLRRTIKKNCSLQKDTLTDEDVNEDQIRGIQKGIAAILYATRNSIVHAKSNYNPTGNEFNTEELSEGNAVMEIIARSIINWNERQAEGFRI